MEINPYSIMFGKEPLQNIRRDRQLRQVADDFTAPDPMMQVYMITGVRGSGKTVFLSDAVSCFKTKKDWIVVSISSDGDILGKIISALTAETGIARIFQNASINLSFFGVGFEVNGAPRITSPEIALQKMLESLKRQGRRVLIAIDEAIRSREMIAFVSAFQLYVRDNLPVFLLMTGLFENIEELQNVKNLTFLYRAPKLRMEPLTLRAVSENYRETLGADETEAQRMAEATMGYPYAFQLAGYFAWQYGHCFTKEAEKELRHRLNDYVYDIIWEQMSGKDRLVAYGIARAKEHSTAEIRELLNMTQNEFNPYRKRLIRKGIVDGGTWGIVRFALPYFREYVLDAYAETLS